MAQLLIPSKPLLKVLALTFPGAQRPALSQAFCKAFKD